MDQQPKPLTDLDVIEQRLRGALLDAIVADGLKPPTERVGLVAAMLAVVRPELARLTAELEQAQQQTATLAAIFEGFSRLLATSSRDCGAYRIDAWLWAVICGWDCEQAEHDEVCVHGAMEEQAQRHGWDAEAVAKARRYRAAVHALTTATAPAAVSGA